MNIVNNTGDTVILVNEDGKVMETYRPQRRAYVNIYVKQVGMCGSVPLMEENFGSIEGLPAPDPTGNTIHIVNPPVLRAGLEEGRKDLVTVYKNPPTHHLIETPEGVWLTRKDKM
jgi:hypothetical protein